MRKIDRTAVKAPDSLHDTNGPGSAELQNARVHFAGKDPGSFPFAAYKASDVVEALQKLFQGKCAYCETRFAAASPMEIEHFRPKGGVAECADHPGYWWLAAQWTNLLASCIDCNRRRYQRAISIDPDPLAGGAVRKTLMGKGDCFPILGPQHARGEDDALDAEDPALIDPTRRNPSDHLVWLEKQDFSLVGPRIRNGEFDPYGKTTYLIFGLNRQALVEDRTRRVREVKAQIVNIERQLDLAATLPDPGSSQLREIAVSQFRSLHKYAESDQLYSAAIQSLLERESERLEQKYSECLSDLEESEARAAGPRTVVEIA